MANHFGGPDIAAAGDGRLNIADFYIFRKPGDPSKSVLILDVDPMTARSEAEFDAHGVYRINVDTDGDARADIAYSVVFSHDRNATQTATVYRAKGQEARSEEAQGEVVVEHAPVSPGSDPIVTTCGEYRFFAGLRSDPFFVDAGIQSGLDFTGTDYFAGTNVLAIVLEVPNGAFESDGPVAVWSRTSRRTDRGVEPWDRAGGPGVAQFLARDAKDLFNASEPFQDRERFTERFAEVLVQGGGYDLEQARAIVTNALLPDVLRYDHSSQAGFPNGRRLDDDVVDVLLAAFTQGRIVSDLVGPHDDYLDDFPYLGTPHPVGAIA